MIRLIGEPQDFVLFRNAVSGLKEGFNMADLIKLDKYSDQLNAEIGEYAERLEAIREWAQPLLNDLVLIEDEDEREEENKRIKIQEAREVRLLDKEFEQKDKIDVDLEDETFKWLKEKWGTIKAFPGHESLRKRYLAVEEIVKNPQPLKKLDDGTWGPETEEERTEREAARRAPPSKVSKFPKRGGR